jgi:hypothetical protein
MIKRIPNLTDDDFILITSFHHRLPIHHPYPLLKLLLGKYPLINNQSSKGFLLDYLRHEEFFNGNISFRFERYCHRTLGKGG